MAAGKTSKNAGSGSPSAGEPLYLLIGSLRRPHGVRGEMVMEVITDCPERIKPNTQVYVGDAYQPMMIANARFHNEGLLIKFKDIDSPEDVGRYRNQLVYVRSSDRPALPKGQYYHHELIGCNVVDETGQLIGQLTEIMQTGANDVYVVTQANGHEILVPVIASVVLDIEPERRLIKVKLAPGLLDESED